MKKPSKSKTVRPIDALLHNVVGGSTGSQMLAGAAAGAATGATGSGTGGTPTGQLGLRIGPAVFLK